MGRCATPESQQAADSPHPPFSHQARISESRLRRPKCSIPVPASAALAELSDSQHNARIPLQGLSVSASPITKGMKRELKQPCSESEPKRQLKAQPERAAERTSKIPGSGAPATVKGVCLSSGIRPPSDPLSRNGPTYVQSSRAPSSTNFANSHGPSTKQAADRPKTSFSTNNRSVNCRARTQPARPRTALGQHEPPDAAAPQSSSNGTENKPLQRQVSPSTATASVGYLAPQSTRTAQSKSGLRETREVSLSIGLATMCLDDMGKHQAVSAVLDRAMPPAPSVMAQPQFSAVPPKRVGKKLSFQHLVDQEKSGSCPATPVPSGDVLKGRMERFEEALTSIVRASKSPFKSPCRHRLPFLTKDSNLTGFTAWDLDARFEKVDSLFLTLKESVSIGLSDRDHLNEVINVFKSRVSDLETARSRLEARNDTLASLLDSTREELHAARLDLQQEQSSNEANSDKAQRAFSRELDDIKRTMALTIEAEQNSCRAMLDEVQRRHLYELDEERSRRNLEILEMRALLGKNQQELGLKMQKKHDESQEVQSRLLALTTELEKERALRSTLQAAIADVSTANITLEARAASFRSRIEFLESDSQAQSDSFADMQSRLDQAVRFAEEARQKLMKEETERRILFNRYQELKGNIRVMCRVRPASHDGSEGDVAHVSFPDDKTSTEISLLGPEEKSSLGVVSRRSLPFEFDRVFGPEARNDDIFAEISQLVQSALDGYNVCIFCYGQTGAGKTFTMSSTDGMIPRATQMIYDTTKRLEQEKSWSYTMEGSFVEVYNEELHDLLSPNSRESDGKDGLPKTKKLEIRHDEIHKQTTVVNCKTVRLDSAESLEQMLQLSQSNRIVAATRSNERSSRSHSVFMLRLTGENTTTGERCDGTLNLVDLAGSERLKQSGAEGERMRETQSINKSLACLGDVIEALGRGSAHIPYRNSKLTHLLQYSLGGNSKTLMFVMVSPLEAHLKETLTSLRFATKVYNTHIGIARATKRVREKGNEG